MQSQKVTDIQTPYRHLRECTNPWEAQPLSLPTEPSFPRRRESMIEANEVWPSIPYADDKVRYRGLVKTPAVCRVIVGVYKLAIVVEPRRSEWKQ